MSAPDDAPDVRAVPGPASPDTAAVAVPRAPRLPWILALVVGLAAWSVGWALPFLESWGHWLLWTALSLGLALTTLLAASLRSAIRRERDASKGVAGRTAELSAALEELRREDAERRRLVQSLERDLVETKRADEERRRLDAQKEHVQRLESLGALAGGVAHDLNNVLMGILGNADLALLHVDPASPAGVRVEDVKRAGLRASELTQQLLAFAGRSRFLVQPVDLNALLRDAAKRLEGSTPQRVRVEFALAPDLPAVEADAAQIRQAVSNLLTNASEAIGDREGVVTLRTGVEDLDAEGLAAAFGGAALPAGRYAFLEVEDTGVGMDEATRRKLFEPFFTTKPAGRGLGLAALLGIVRGHHGAVRVRSEKGAGSAFRILLPPTSGTLVPHAKAPESAPAAAKSGGTVLVIDDDPAVLDVVSLMLEGAGHRVLRAADGPGGVEEYRAQADRVDVVILDLSMPGLSGEETLREIRAIRPDARILLTSGLTEEDATARFAGLSLSGFVQKPFERETLLRRVASAIADRVRLG